jgi:hypothetical protein
MTSPTLLTFEATAPGIKASTRLRQLLAQDGIVVAPGVYDGLSTRAALAAGHLVLYGTGAGITGSRLGMPDLALASQDGASLAGLSGKFSLSLADQTSWRKAG